MKNTPFIAPEIVTHLNEVQLFAHNNANDCIRIIVEGIRPNYSYQDIGGAGDRETWDGLVNRRSQLII